MNTNIIFNEEDNKWLSKKEICNICNVDEKTFRRFKKETNLESSVQVKKNLKQGDKNVDYYTEQVLQKFQLWLKKNAMNAGGQRTEGSIIKQDNQQDLFIGGNMKQIESGKVMTIKQIVDGINSNIKCGKLIGRDRIERTIKKLFPTKMKRGETTYLTEAEATLLLDVLQKNPKSLEQTSAAGAEVLKSTSTNLSPALKMKQAFDLMNEAYQEEITRLKQQNIEVVEENGVLKLENKQLVEENNYLKKLTDFQTTQLGYYTKKYHSWYDNYENY